MYCKHCGGEISAPDRFCPYCRSVIVSDYSVEFSAKSVRNPGQSAYMGVLARICPDAFRMD